MKATTEGYLNTRVEGRVLDSTFNILTEYMRWQQKHVNRSRRTKVCRLVARCVDRHLAEVIEADRRAHLERKEAATAE